MTGHLRPGPPPPTGRPAFSVEIDADTPVYVISVAAELTGLHPQTLRGYDRLGLVSPGRSVGGSRRYSLRDIETLRQVVELTAAGLGLEGVRQVLALQAQVTALRERVGELEAALAETQDALQLALDRAPLLPARRPVVSRAVAVFPVARRRR